MADLISRIQAHPEIQEIGLFGSAIFNNNREPNDLDISIFSNSSDNNLLINMLLNSIETKKLSFNGYGDKISISSNGIFDISFFDNQIKYDEFKRYNSNNFKSSNHEDVIELIHVTALKYFK